MRKYIGTKLVEAEPAWRLNGKLYTWDALPDSADHAEAGYRVRYPDGYESWSPWAVFEAAYLRVNPDGECKTGAPSVSPGMVGELLGFLLQTAVNGINAGDSTVGQAPEAAGPVGQAPGPWGAVQEAEHPCGGNCVCAEERRDFGWALRQLRHGGAVRRRGWNGKNQHIELATRISYMTAGGVYMNVEHEAIGNKAIAFVGTSGVQMGWLASQADMLAEDWEIVE